MNAIIHEKKKKTEQNKGCPSIWWIFSGVEEVQDILRQLGVSFSHILWDANVMADALTREKVFSFISFLWCLVSFFLVRFCFCVCCFWDLPFVALFFCHLIKFTIIKKMLRRWTHVLFQCVLFFNVVFGYIQFCGLSLCLIKHAFSDTWLW